MELGSAGLAYCVLGTSWLPCACRCLLVSSWDVQDVKVGPWGLFGQALSSQLGISLAGNAASKPHPLNKFLALEGKLAPTAIQSLPPSPGARSGPRGAGRKAPTGCMDPWDGKRAGEADSSLFISCLAHCVGGESTCASYTEKGCPKSCPWHSPSQRCFPVLNGVSKFLLLWIRDFACPRDSQGLLSEELWDDIWPAQGYYA